MLKCTCGGGVQIPAIEAHCPAAQLHFTAAWFSTGDGTDVDLLHGCTGEDCSPSQFFMSLYVPGVTRDTASVPAAEIPRAAGRTQGV
ncbi:hypothetical protein NDU88_006299 [Pleurodeles waltl]|uniref:Uncharacterized protein n=1 Tax=Pleurodeles waltl TaxID=8319 RepID=A0AAV7NSW0_PLEWA|nr:hypothetical protein NDU88_006299 [Pleurodeles waltl]